MDVLAVLLALYSTNRASIMLGALMAAASFVTCASSSATGPPRRTLILGAAGRDFHNFNVLWREDPTVAVVGFTATQIPEIDDKLYPPELAGPLYPDGIRIYPEDELEMLIKAHKFEQVVFAYSDVSHENVRSSAQRTRPPQTTPSGTRFLHASACDVGDEDWR